MSNKEHLKIVYKNPEKKTPTPMDNANVFEFDLNSISISYGDEVLGATIPLVPAEDVAKQMELHPGQFRHIWLPTTCLCTL